LIELKDVTDEQTNGQTDAQAMAKTHEAYLSCDKNSIKRRWLKITDMKMT